MVELPHGWVRLGRQIAGTGKASPCPRRSHSKKEVGQIMGRKTEKTKAAGQGPHLEPCCKRGGAPKNTQKNHGPRADKDARDKGGYGACLETTVFSDPVGEWKREERVVSGQRTLPSGRADRGKKKRRLARLGGGRGDKVTTGCVWRQLPMQQKRWELKKPRVPGLSKSPQ